MKILIGIVGVVLLLIAGAIGFNLNQPEQSVGSVERTSEYHSTTMLATTSAYYLFHNGSGSLGQITINVLGTGNAIFYDATTTNYLKRTGQVATSSLNVVGVIAASQAAGTYTYDNIFVDGLLGVFNGSQGTSTVMHRP